VTVRPETAVERALKPNAAVRLCAAAASFGPCQPPPSRPSSSAGSQTRFDRSSPPPPRGEHGRRRVGAVPRTQTECVDEARSQRVRRTTSGPAGKTWEHNSPSATKQQRNHHPRHLGGQARVVRMNVGTELEHIFQHQHGMIHRESKERQPPPAREAGGSCRVHRTTYDACAAGMYVPEISPLIGSESLEMVLPPATETSRGSAVHVRMVCTYGGGSDSCVGHARAE